MKTLATGLPDLPFANESKLVQKRAKI